MKKQRARWGRPTVDPNSKIREALLACRKAAEGIRAYSEALQKEADAVEARVASGETEVTPEDKERLERMSRG
jgi:hypothetical protein